jgi:uncharacterized pyridoxamine 5'-phosphate oxidase family protein
MFFIFKVRELFMNFLNLIRENPAVFFSTVRDGEVRVRPMTMTFVEDGHIYFATLKDKEIVSDLEKNNYAQFTFLAGNLVSVRVTGKVEFTDDIEKKNKALKNNKLLQKVVKSPDSDRLAVFYIKSGKIDIYDLRREEPQIREVCFI